MFNFAKRSPVAAIAVLATLALAGCQSSAPRADALAAAPAASAAVAAMPAGAGCSASVNRFRTLMDTDLASGHTTRSVHAQVTGEINAAAQLCASGNDAGARAAISASRARHGYPAG